jgi:hypothetical protein
MRADTLPRLRKFNPATKHAPFHESVWELGRYCRVYVSKDMPQALMTMTKERNYQINATEAVQLAQRASTSADKWRLLRLAERWLDLADRARECSHRIRKSSKLHPLILDKIDRHLSE